MISEERALEIANEYLTRDGGAAPRLMGIRYYESSPLEAVTQISYTKKGIPRYTQVPIWKEPVWFIRYFYKEGVPGSYDILVNAKTGELLANPSIQR